ncbi:hypothetical protein HanIR_Chr07g0307661 [Helianthus annuus]|nr:hypothetical protein HanIR_Chr07g0307661 [Helianthus annuus]
MVFQLSFNSFTLNALKTDRIGARSDLLLFLSDVSAQDLSSIKETTDFGLNMNNRLEQWTDRTWVIPVRSGHSSLDGVSVVWQLSYRLEKTTKLSKQ